VAARGTKRPCLLSFASGRVVALGDDRDAIVEPLAFLRLGHKQGDVPLNAGTGIEVGMEGAGRKHNQALRPYRYRLVTDLNLQGAVEHEVELIEVVEVQFGAARGRLQLGNVETGVFDPVASWASGCRVKPGELVR